MRDSASLQERDRCSDITLSQHADQTIIKDYERKAKYQSLSLMWLAILWTPHESPSTRASHHKCTRNLKGDGRHHVHIIPLHTIRELLRIYTQYTDETVLKLRCKYCNHELQHLCSHIAPPLVRQIKVDRASSQMIHLGNPGLLRRFAHPQKSTSPPDTAFGSDNAFPAQEATWQSEGLAGPPPRKPPEDVDRAWIFS